MDDLVLDARRRLARTSFAPSLREAALLLGHVLGWNEARVLARGDQTVEPEAARRFAALLERRLTGEPVAYLLEEREFYGRPFHVDRRVLVPRPETEHLVEAALALPLPDAPRLLDVGTGSGCLAITLALEIPTARVVATDLSPAALAVAARNRRRHGLDRRLHLLAADLWTPLDLGSFDAVVSNPPYVDRAVAPELSPEVVEHEPGLALFAAEGGLAVLHRMLRLAAGPDGLAPGAHLLLEVGHDQAAAVEKGATARGLNWIQTRRDYAGIARTIHLRRPRQDDDSHHRPPLRG